MSEEGGIGWMGLVALECFWNTLYHGHYFDENYQIEFLGWFCYYQTCWVVGDSIGKCGTWLRADCGNPELK